MSHTGDEERLSTPTEESIEEEIDNQKQRESNEHKKVTVKAVSIPKKKVGTKMTHSNSSDRDTTEDSNLPRRFVQVSEENVVLKRQLKKQEERIKILATKLIRVISERGNKSKREEILLEEQKARIGDLEHEVSILREKLQVTKQQLSSHTRLIPHHHHPPSRQPSMLSSSSTTSHSKVNKKGRPSRSSSAGASQPPRPSTAASSTGENLLIDKNFADRVEELLLEAKAENQALEDQLKHCRQRLASTEENLEKVKEALKSKESEHQEQIMSIKSQVEKDEDMVNQKKELSGNIQLIRLQREARRTASWLSTLEAQNRALEADLSTTKESLQQLETQLSETQDELGNEQQKNLTLQKKMEDATSSLSRLRELDAQIISLQEENKIMKETNQSLLKNAFSVKEKAEKAESIQSTMRAQMAHLETALKAEMRSKHDVQESLRVEKEKYMRLEIANEHLQKSLDKINDEMKRRGELCCGNDDTPKCVDTTAILISSNSTSAASNNIDDITDTCPNQRNVSLLKNELSSVRNQLESEKSEHSKTTLLLKTQAAETEKLHRKVDELSAESNKADEFHCQKLRELVSGLEERKKQISYLEKCMDDWKRQQSSTNLVCKVCESRSKTEVVNTEGSGDTTKPANENHPKAVVNNHDNPMNEDTEKDSIISEVRT